VRVLGSAQLRSAVLTAWALSIVLVAALSVLPVAGPSGRYWSDKLSHAVAYLCLGLGAAFGLGARRGALGALAMIAYGWTLEGVQIALPWRTAEILDGLANTGGVLVGAGIGYLLVRLTGR
jgi:VanZ family protein